MARDVAQSLSARERTSGHARDGRRGGDRPGSVPGLIQPTDTSMEME
jgi:hypothetical protein